MMAHPVRLMILEALSEGPKCVKDLNGLVNIVQPRLSQHMAVLRTKKLIACHSCGTLRCYYLLRPTLIRKLIRLLQQEHSPCVRDRRDVLREVQRITKVSQTKRK
jgi:ArsR family transcriptional regulator